MDLALADTDPVDIGQIVVGHLASKGFCSISTGLDGDVLSQALKDAANVDAAGRLRRPAELVVEGLLGAQGSARVAHLTSSSGEASAEDFGQGLRQVDEVIGDLAGHVEPHLEDALGKSSHTRSHTVLHESGAVQGEAPDLTYTEASDWLFQFMRGFIMCLVSIGPETGTLELAPFDAEAEAYSLEVAPGSMVLLRSDAVAARYRSSGRGLLLSSFLLEVPARPDKHDTEPELTPCAQRLSDWATERLDRLKDDEKDDERLNVPRDWIIAMNRQCFKGQHMAARGMACRMPATWNEDEFFMASFAGVDYLVEVPLMRWDHSARYNPDPEAYRYNQTYSKHFSIVDGAELFDNKKFAITPAESKVMDPQQRVVLENGYEALIKGGYKKGQIMNSTGGMYLGFGTNTSDFSFMEKSNDAGAEGSFGATGGSAAICSNRFSFCMGMRGPSISIDGEDASASVAIHLGCEGLQRRGRLTNNFFSLVGGIKLNLSPYFWPHRQAMGVSSAKGRCMSFDASGDGMALGDNATNITLNALTEVVDNQTVVKEYDELIGVVAGSATGHNGKSAHFNAPHGPAEQEVMSNALRGAGLNGFDIEACECYAYGAVLSDAVEVSSTMRILRMADQCDDPLGLTAIKSSAGNNSWATGAASFARSVLGNHWGCMTPNVHLNQINPHIDAADQPMNFIGETVEFRMRSSYTQTFTRGFGGLNASVIAYGNMDSEKRRPAPQPERERERLTFWPGGGGKLDAAAVPRKGFHIAGTFTQWEPEAMEMEGTGVYGYTLTLSENRWEQFQIWLDGDPRRCLFPDLPKAPKQTAVRGPSASSGGNAWHIEGRTHAEPAYAGDGTGPDALQDRGPASDALATPAADRQMVEVGTLDRGFIGAKYRVRLHVAGKYRLVDWERLSGKPEVAELAGALQACAVLPRSSYFITADWNGWGVQEMTEIPGADEQTVHFALEIQLLRAGGEFQIIRNRDWEQAIYPVQEMYNGQDPSAVSGPDDESDGRAWFLDGQPGDRFKIELVRSRVTGLDVKKVSWTKLGREALTQEQKESVSVPRLSVFGSWDQGMRLRQLRWNGEYHYFFVELGDDAKASFQLVRDFDWDQIFHPSIQDANPDKEFEVKGPSPADGRTRGLNWTIGLQGTETSGEIYEVRAFHEERVMGAVVRKVEWSRVSSGVDLSGAEAEGLVQRARKKR